MINYNIGDDVVVLKEYHLFYGKVVKTNDKSIKVYLPAQIGFKEHTINYKYEKVLKFGTKAVIVWEIWKGVNGRGAYRLETKMYSEYHKNVEHIQRDTFLWEDKFGILRT